MNPEAQTARVTLWATVVAALAAAQAFPRTTAADEVRSVRVELAGQQHNAVKTSWPGIFLGFLDEETLKPGAYEPVIDHHAKHTGLGLVTLTIRAPVEVTQPAVRERVGEITAYAATRGIGVAMDLDVRLARQAFMDQYPDELQEIVRLREVALTGVGDVTCAVEPFSCGDHYTFNARPYESVAGRVLRVYSYVAGAAGPEPDSVRDDTGRCKVEASAKGVTVVIPADPQDKGRTACVMATFALFTPDVFAPHLLEFQEAILTQYAGVPLAGACKDEWGFPGRIEARTDDLWFSTAMAAAYARRRPGRDLGRDLLLMSRGERGREADRAAAINHYMEMFWQRNGAIEADFYRATKAVFGPRAVVATHPTWYPMPNRAEAFKNGMNWWVAPRDLAQSDEGTPFCARTALAKKWRSPLWYNMYYSPTKPPYEHDLWSHALGGGRMNFHPIYPPGAETAPLHSGDLFRADCRVRLLNYISTAPVDCPVAVVFGHPAALNWAAPGFADVGLRVTDALWQLGHYADLIPSSEIANGHLVLGDDGHIQYGAQRYAAVVLYGPQYERPAVGAFFRDAAAKGKTALFRVGDWTADFDGAPFDGAAALPAAMAAGDADAATRGVVSRLTALAVEPQTPGSARSTAGFPPSVMPNPSGRCRLLDGTVILASGETNVMGDPIQQTIKVNGHPVTFDAIGVAAVRVRADGQLTALAAGGLKHFQGGGLTLDLPEPADLALWRNAAGRWTGVLQGFGGALPEPLARITKDWTRLSVPTPFTQ